MIGKRRAHPRRGAPRPAMHPQLRPMGALLRAAVPDLMALGPDRLNAVQERVMVGRWPSLVTRARTVETPREDGSILRLLVVEARRGSRRGSDPRTGLLWIHGGGYAIGAPEQDRSFLDLLLADGGTLAVLPYYRRSVEAPYPAALEDCRLALAWLHAYASELGVDPARIAVAGESAGGGLAASLCLSERDRARAGEDFLPIAFQMPLYPMLDDREAASSRDNDAPVWSSAANRRAWALHLRGLPAGAEPPALAAPARATDYSDLPPTLTYLGTIEPFHEETLAYCAALCAAGVPVLVREYEGCFHAFDMIAPWSAPARAARAFLRAGFLGARERFRAPAPASRRSAS